MAPTPRDEETDSGNPRTTRGQASVLGLALVLGIALVGATGIVLLGASALEDAQHESEVEAAEHVMTQFDSQVALVALGESDQRTLSFGRRGGQYDVHPTRGRISIVHKEYNGSGTADITLYEANLGEVTYQNGETTIAYQGGGVWRRSPGGGSRMVSPPEFHYRGATLTFPIIRVAGGNGGSGFVSADITSAAPVQDVYPSSQTYPNGEVYANPADEGQVVITIESQYYRGWADYFRTRTQGNITVDESNEKVTVKLLSTGITGNFQMPNEGSSLPIQGIGDHSMNDFSITLVPDDTDSAEFNNLQWSMHAEESDKQLEIHLRKGGGADDTNTPCKEVYVEATVYYSPADGDSNNEDPYHGWHSDTAYTTECYDADGDGKKDETRAVIDFVDDEDGDGSVEDVETGDPLLTYGSLSKSDTQQYDPQHATVIASPTFDEHQTSVSWESKTYAAGDTESVDRLINHYFSLMDRVDLTVSDKNSNTITESGSSGNIEYVGGDKYITFLHITENEVNVDIQ